MWAYPSDDAALTDVLRLSEGMTYKNSLAGLDLGGGKTVVVGDARVDKTPEKFRALGRFIANRPTIKMLALAFLFMIGLVLIADGFDHHVPKGYVYFAMAFSVLVEMLNSRVRRKRDAVRLRELERSASYHLYSKPTVPWCDVSSLRNLPS